MERAPASSQTHKEACISISTVSILWPHCGLFGKQKTTVPEKDPFLNEVQPLTAAVAYSVPLSKGLTHASVYLFSHSSNNHLLKAYLLSVAAQKEEMAGTTFSK